MPHDVFISYSSKQKDIADAICQVLEEHDIRCWIAPRDIPIGAKYAAVITRAIKECKLAVLLFSELSAVSPWVESEINIAFSNRKPILPYKVDNANLSDYDEFYLMLNNRHWIESVPDFRTCFNELLLTVSRMLGITPQKKKVPQDSIVEYPNPLLMIVEHNPPTARRYEVGDYYNDNGIEGVVFEVSADGLHGKVVSMNETKTIWGQMATAIGATSAADGQYNTDKLEQLGLDNFPAAQWCRNKGPHWFLPSKEELLVISCKKGFINRTLEKHRAPQLNIAYWSSTESITNFAWGVRMSDGSTDSFYKPSISFVRAVSVF